MNVSTGRTSLFSTPAWLRDLGFASWLLVGFVLIIIGVIWLLGQTSTIVMPVIVAAVLGAVVAPLFDAIARRGAPRAVGAGAVLLGLVAIALLVVFLVVHGISANSDDVSAQATKALDKVDGWLKDAGINPADAKEGVKKAAPEIRETLVSGVATGINGLTSVLFFLSFAALATFFVLKDAPVMSRFITRHMGLPVPVAEIVTREIAKGLRNYFTGVTIIAAFNALLVGMGALILGVPLAGTSGPGPPGSSPSSWRSAPRGPPTP
jgi:putative heme transporter